MKHFNSMVYLCVIRTKCRRLLKRLQQFVTKQALKPLLGLPALLLPGIGILSILNAFDLSDLDETAPLLLVSPALQTLH